MYLRAMNQLLAIVLCAVSGTAGAVPAWEQVVPAAAGLLNSGGQLVDRDGTPLTDNSGSPLEPKCAVPNGGPFRFFVQPGEEPDKLLLFHTGGGACWNAATCASGLQLLEGVGPTYAPVILETTQSLTANSTGVLSADPSKNPFARWTKVFIPYCTGDVGWGNRDTVYQLPAPVPGGVAPLPISHRGYANIRTVKEYLHRRFQAPGNSLPTKAVVSGSSAGGYAAIGPLFAETVDLIGRTADVSVIGDSANGVVTDDFLQRARANWGFDATLAAHVLSAVDQGADGLAVRVYSNQMQWHRGARFGQFQNAYDLVQARVLNIMQHPDQPGLWSDPTAVGAALGEWTVKARANVLVTALNPRYRFYTAAGYEHVVLQEVPAQAGLGFCSDHFDTEATANTLRGPLKFREWTKDMANRSNLTLLSDDWRNATCFPNCNVPPICPPPAP